jgi:hypothetical protein
MNERIKLLAEYATTEECDGWKYFDKEKFAELIVRECLDEIQYDDGATHVNDLLPKHFGFEL